MHAAPLSTGSSRGRPCAAAHGRRRAAAAVRATQQTGGSRDNERPAKIAVAAAAASLALHLGGGGTALAASAALAGGTVPLKRAVVEDMLLQRLTDRLHALSDQQLADLLEQLLQDDARFPAGLLQQQQPAIRQQPQQQQQPAIQQQPQQQQQQPPPQPQLQPPQPLPTVQPPSQGLPDRLPDAGSATSQAGPAAVSSSSPSPGAIAEDTVVAEQQEAPDLTEQLLQQFQRQLEAPSGGSGAAGDRMREAAARGSSSSGAVDGLFPPFSAALSALANWRLAVLAVVGPGLLIFTLGQLLGAQGKKQQQEQQQQQQLQQRPAEDMQPPPAARQEPPAAGSSGGAAAAGAPQRHEEQQEQQSPAGKAEKGSGQNSVLSWLFGRKDKQKEDASAAAAVAPAKATPAAADSSLRAAASAGSQQQQPLPPLPPMPPPPPPQQPQQAAYVAADASASGSSAAAAPGAVLWRRKGPAEPAAPSAGAGIISNGAASAAGEGPVLWRRQGAAPLPPPPALPVIPIEQQRRQPRTGQIQPQPELQQGEAAGFAANGAADLDPSSGINGGQAGSSSSSSASSSSASDVDLWRLPIDQLRSASGSSSGGGAVPAEGQDVLPPAAVAAAEVAGALVHEETAPAVEEGSPSADAQEQQTDTGSGSGPAPTEATTPSHAPASAEAAPAPDVADVGEASQRSPSPAAPTRRPSSALDNAEPEGWLGRLQRMGRRPPMATHGSGSGE